MAYQQPIDLSISLLSFNNRELLANCLLSIYQNTKTIKFEILLVDNNSQDGTVSMVKKNFPQVKIIANRQNLLFIKGHNQNLRRVKGRYFLLLNEDTYLPPKTLDKMAAFMDQNPQIGLTSCRQSDDQGKIDTTCSRFPTPLAEILESSLAVKTILKLLPLVNTPKILKDYRYANWDRRSIREVEVLPGSFIIGRQEVLEKIGYLDENLLFFYGEADFCQRTKKAGFKIYHKGDVAFTHFGSKGLKKLSSFARYQLTQHDILVYYKKYFGIFWWLILWLLLAPNWLYARLQKN